MDSDRATSIQGEGIQIPEEMTFGSEVRLSEAKYLRQQLKVALNDRDPKKQFSVVELVITHMTMGIDVSSIFGEMVIAGNTRDIRQKKLVYHYLCHYASSQPELSLLSVCTLQKDCSDHSPTIRGLALRAMCNLRVPNIVEYLIPLIEAGLSDTIPYVRKTAVLAISKLYTVAPNSVLDSKMLGILKMMIKDPNFLVAKNSICALKEICRGQNAEFELSKDELFHLLGNFSERNEWDVCFLLSLLVDYVPETDEELYGIMNMIDERLRHPNSAVVFGTIRVFLKLTENNKDLYSDVLQRIKHPLLSIVNSCVDSPELLWATLEHVNLILTRNSELFSSYYKFFFCQYNEPSYISHLKMKILVGVVNSENVEAILNEFSCYATDFDPWTNNCSRKALQAIAEIAVKQAGHAEYAVKVLLDLMEFNITPLNVSIMLVMQDLLRRYPEHANVVLPHLPPVLKSVNDTEAKAAIIWVLGEFGSFLDESPYLVEDLSENYEEESAQVKLQLLTTSMKLFFARPGEMQPILGDLLARATNDVSNVDVHDRALMYYRMLLDNPEKIKQCFTTPASLPDIFVELDEIEHLDLVLDEFDSMSVVFGKPANLWQKLPSPQKQQDDDRNHEHNDNGNGNDNINFTTTSPTPQLESKNVLPAPPSYTNKSVDLLGDLDFLDSSLPKQSSNSIQLIVNPAIQPAKFQELWGKLGIANQSEMKFSGANEKGANKIRGFPWIFLLASGVVGDVLKLYLYAEEEISKTQFLIEALLHNQSISMTLKTTDESYIDKFLTHFRTNLGL